jgi:Flp pilus assembly protein TadB
MASKKKRISAKNVISASKLVKEHLDKEKLVATGKQAKEQLRKENLVAAGKRAKEQLNKENLIAAGKKAQDYAEEKALNAAAITGKRAMFLLCISLFLFVVGVVVLILAIVAENYIFISGGALAIIAALFGILRYGIIYGLMRVFPKLLFWRKA